MKRYSIDYDSGGESLDGNPSCDIYEDANGDWCRWVDVNAEIATLQQQLAVAEARFAEMTTPTGCEIELQQQLVIKDKKLANVRAAALDWMQARDVARQQLADATARADRTDKLLLAATEIVFGRTLTEADIPHSGISDQAIRAAYELLDFYNKETEAKLAAATAEIERLTQRLAAAEARYSNVSRLYEELRQITDGGSESMTHTDAVQALRDQDDQLEAALAERDVLLACRHGDQRCHECPDVQCCDNQKAREGADVSKHIRHSIRCRGYRGVGNEFADNDCDCGATISHLTLQLSEATSLVTKHDGEWLVQSALQEQLAAAEAIVAERTDRALAREQRLAAAEEKCSEWYTKWNQLDLDQQSLRNQLADAKAHTDFAEDAADAEKGLRVDAEMALEAAEARIYDLRQLLETACDAWECGQTVTRSDGIVLADFMAAILPRAWYQESRNFTATEPSGNPGDLED